MTPGQLAAFETGAGFSVANFYVLVSAIIGITLIVWGACVLVAGFLVGKEPASLVLGAGVVLSAITVAVGLL